MMESAEVVRKARHAEEMLPLLKRHEIQVLLRAGHSQTDVAARTGASVDTVQRVRRKEEVRKVDDNAERRERKIGRPSKASPFGARVTAWLVEDPDLPTQELLRRAMEVGYVGHKPAFYALVAVTAEFPESRPQNFRNAQPAIVALVHGSRERHHPRRSLRLFTVRESGTARADRCACSRFTRAAPPAAIVALVHGSRERHHPGRSLRLFTVRERDVRREAHPSSSSSPRSPMRTNLGG